MATYHLYAANPWGVPMPYATFPPGIMPPEMIRQPPVFVNGTNGMRLPTSSQNMGGCLVSGQDPASLPRGLDMLAAAANAAVGPLIVQPQNPLPELPAPTMKKSSRTKKPTTPRGAAGKTSKVTGAGSLLPTVPVPPSPSVGRPRKKTIAAIGNNHRLKFLPPLHQHTTINGSKVTYGSEAQAKLAADALDIASNSPDSAVEGGDDDQSTLQTSPPLHVVTISNSKGKLAAKAAAERPLSPNSGVTGVDPDLYFKCLLCGEHVQKRQATNSRWRMRRHVWKHKAPSVGSTGKAYNSQYKDIVEQHYVLINVRTGAISRPGTIRSGTALMNSDD